jgi:hypothetical protein
VADQPAIDYSRLPAFGTSRPDAEKKPARGLVAAGLHSGLNDLESVLGAAVLGGGKAFGLPSVENAGRSFMQSSDAAATVNGRPDLETAPWHTGGAPVLPWLAYQSAKQAPMIATYLLGGKVAGMAGLEAPTEFSRVGAVVPRALGGGGLRAGADFATRRAALAAGKEYANSVAQVTTAGLPLAFGSMVQEADQKPGGVTVQDVKRAALLSPIYSALDATEPAQLKGLFQRGQAGSIIRRVATAAFAGAAAEVPQEGLQTAMEQSFRPDLTLSQKFANVVDAAVTGGAVGGVFGGFGGIRSMKRVNPGAVTNEDMSSVVDQALGLAAPLQLPAPPAFADSNGRVAMGSQGDFDLRQSNAPAPGQEPFDVGEQQPPALISPQDVEGRSTIPGSTIVVGRRGESGRFTSDATGVEQPPVVPDDTSRSFRNFTNDELFAAGNALANRREASGWTQQQALIAKKIDEELTFRRQSGNGSLTESNVSTQPVEAVEREGASRRGTGEQPNSAPASASPQDWSAQRGGLLTGISTRKHYTEATNAEDLKSRLQARLEAGSAAAGDFKLAERLGIDTNESAVPVATEKSRASQSSTQEAALADPEFMSLWKADVQKLGQKDKGARAIKPTNEADAQVQIYRALGAKAEIGNGLEALARKYGVLDDQNRLTPLAVEIAKKDPITTEQAVKAAVTQGFKGASASMFDRGVKAFLGGPQETKFSSKDDFAAYTAGAQWAEQHNSVPKGALKKYAPSGYTGEITDQQVSQANGAQPVAQPRVVPPEVKQAQTVNKAVDATQAAFATPDDDIAQLKTMVRNGDIEGAMEGLQKVQRGERLFQQPKPQPSTFTGEVVTRGAPRVERTATLVPTQATSRAAAERAIRKYQVMQAIGSAHSDGAIERKDVIRLVSKVNRGKVSDVINELRGAGQVVDFDKPAANPARAAEITKRIEQRQALVSDLQEAFRQAVVDSEVSELSVDDRGVLRNEQVKVARRDFLTGVAAAIAVNSTPVKAALSFTTPAKAELVKLIRNGGQDMNRALPILQHLKDHASDPSYRMIATKLLRGNPGAWDAVMIGIWPNSAEARGVTTLNDDGSSTIQIMGEDGLNEQTILHELIHAYVQQRWSGISTYNEHNKAMLKDVKDRNDATVFRFRELWRKFNDAIEKTNPGLVDKEVWALASSEDSDELLAWTLTNPDAQAYLKSIDLDGNRVAPEKKASEKTFWDHIVDFFREIFGITNRKAVSALDQIMGAGYAVLDAGANVKTGDFNTKLAGELRRERLENPMRKGPPTNPREFNDRAQEVVSSIASKVPIESANVATRKMVFGWNSVGHLVAHYAKQFPQLALYAKAHLDRRALQARFAQLFEAPYAAYQRLERAEPKFADTIIYLMSLTQYEIDPTKTWDQHEHLQSAVNADRLKALVEDANRKYNVLRGKGHAQIYDDFRAINETDHLAMMSVSLHNLVASDPVLAQDVEGFETDPTDAFRESAQLHESAQNALRYWSDMLDNQVKRASEYVTQLRGEAIGSSKEQKTKAMRLEPIELRIKSIQQSLAAMRNAPYFHLGRHGEHFVSFTLRLGQDKKTVDQAAIDHAGKVIQDAGFKNVEISRDSTKPNVYIRVETIEARHQLERSSSS